MVCLHDAFANLWTCLLSDDGKKLMSLIFLSDLVLQDCLSLSLFSSLSAFSINAFIVILIKHLNQIETFPFTRIGYKSLPRHAKIN